MAGTTSSKGSWTHTEKSQFENGVITHGWGKWRAIEQLVSTRDRSQIKSHAQKFRKHHPESCDLLQEKHEACADLETCTIEQLMSTRDRSHLKSHAQKFRKDVLQEKHEACAEAEVAVAKKTKKEKATPRRRGSLSKARTPTDRVIASPRSRRRCSSPGNISASLKAGGGEAKRRGSIRACKISSPTEKSTQKKAPKKKTARRSLPLSPRTVLAGITSGVRRVTLDSPPTISAKCFDFMSPRAGRPLPAALKPPEDDGELAAMASTVTPSPDPKSANRNLLVEATNMDMSLACLTKLDYNHDEEIFDPLLQLEVDDNNLDMISEFLDPSWNVMLDNKDVFFPKGDDILPIMSLSEGTESMGMPGIEDYYGKPLLEIPANVSPDLQLFMDIRTQLTSLPDFNNPKEYVLTDDGLSRTGAERGVLCRVRIKHLLDENLSAGWWRDDVFEHGPFGASPTGEVVIQSGIGTLGTVADGGGKGGEKGGLVGKDSFKKYALERLIALAAVMLDVDHWHTHRAQKMSDVGTITMDSQRFNDEDDIRHIGLLLSGLWERVSRSLRRDGFSLLGYDGAMMERNTAINTMVGMLDSISSPENTNSPHVPMVSV